MRRHGSWLVAGLLFLAVAMAGTAGAQPGGPNPPQPMADFPTGSFPESLAVRAGDLYVSLGFAGEVARVTSDGSQTPYASGLPIGGGLLTGLAFDKGGNLYVAVATFAADPASGVLMIPPGGGSFTRVLTLPAGSFPNGLAVHGKYLYVSDSNRGAIWRLPPTLTNTALSAPWYQSPLLAPAKKIGANGIAFDGAGSHLYVAVSDQGRIMRLTLAANGSVSAAAVVTEQQQLRSADGIAFDSAGSLLIAVNDTNRLYRLSLPDASLTTLAGRSDGLSYPTQPAFDTTPGSTRLYLTNGAFFNGLAGVEAFDGGVCGLPLP